MKKTTIQTFTALAAVALSTVSVLAAGTDTWVGNTDANWNTAANWTTSGGSTPPANGDSLVFGAAGTSGTSLNNDITSLLVNNLTINSGASAFTMGGNGLTLNGTLTDGASVNETFGSGIILGSFFTAIKNTGSGTLDLGALTRTAGSGGSVNFTPTGTIHTTTANNNGILGGWATVGNAGTAGASGDWAAVDGSGNIITYAGYTTITASQGAGSYSAQNWKVPSTSGSALALTASATVNSLVLGQDFSISSSATMTLGSGGLILSGVSRWFKNNGNGDLVGTAQLTSGLAGGELFVDSSGSGGTGDNDWQIWVKIVDNTSPATAVKVVKNGPGFVKLDNANTYTGGTIMNGGVLVANRVDALGTGTVQVNSGSVTVDNLQNVNGNLNNNFSGGGTVTIQNTGTGNISVNMNGDWSGFTGILNYNPTTKTMNLNSAASMDLSHAAVVFSSANAASSFRTSVTGTTKFGSLASGSGNFNLFVNGATEIGNLGTSTTFGGVISQAGSVTKVGTGTLTLSGANSYTGATTVNGGILQMNSANATTPSVTVNTGATLALNVGDALGATTAKNVPTINSGGTINNITSAARVTLWNGLTMTGGTLGGTGTGDANGAYSLSGTVVATSDAGGIAATISGGPISLQNQNVASGAITFNITRGSATPASDLNVSANLVPNSSAANVGITKSGTGIMTLSGANTYTGTTTISAGTLQLGGGSLGNTAIAFSSTGTFAVKPGSSSAIGAGSTGAGSAGATLNLGGQTFDMGDSATSTFNLQQQTSSGSTALTIANGATLKFDLGGSTTAADLLAVTKAASVSGTVNVTVNTIGSTALSSGTYNIITAASGLSGTWQFTGGGTKQTVTLGGTRSNIHLNNASTVVSLTVANAYAVTYNGNGNTGGSVPTDGTYYDSGASVTVAAAGSMAKTGYTFNGWNTQADGSGTAYSAGGSFNISSDMTLYAQWTLASATITASSTFPGSVSTTYGTASSAQSVAVSGTSLTANITATVTTSGLEISSDGTTYGTTATFTQTGGSASGTLYVRLATSAPVSGSYNSQNVSLASAGASTVNVSTTASGNTVSAKALTVTGAVAQSKLYDGGTAATITGTLSGVVNSDNVTLVGTGTFSSSAVGGPYTVTSTSTLGGTAAGNYTLTQPTGLTAYILSSAVWNNTAGGLWGTAGNWLDSVIGTGSGVTADFSQVDITADTTVNLDSAQTIGNLIFGNTDASPAANWTLANNGNSANTLTLAGTTPTVTVNALGTGKSATISAIVAGTSGLTKTGNGTLTLAGANTYTSTTTVSAGTLNYSGTLGVSPATAADVINVGVASGGNATLNIQSGANIRMNSVNLLAGNGTTITTGNGFIYQSGSSTITGINQLQLGAGASGASYGYYNLSGTASIGMSEFDLGSFNGAAVGVCDISGGTMNVANWFVPSRPFNASGGIGILNMTGGTFNYNGPSGQFLGNWNAGGGTAVLNIANASLIAANANINLMQTGNSGNLGEVNLLSGGLLQASSIAPGSATGSSLLNFNGGTLKANTANATFITTLNMAVNVYGGGGTIDNNGIAITIPKALSAPAGNGINSAVTITAGGSGYVGAPAVTFSGGGAGAVGAAGYATISGGAVTGIVITSPGTGYSAPPTIVLTGGGGSGAAATAPTPTANTSGGMTFQGSGTTTLTVANTYTGNTTLSAGTAKFSNASAFGTGTVTFSGGTLQAGGAFTLANNLTVASAASFDIAGNNTTLSGNLGGSAALNFNNSAGAATVELSGNNSSYGGTFTLNNNNAVNFSAANAGSAGAAWVFNDSTADRVRINIGNGTINFGSISGSGQLQNDTSGTASTIGVGALNTSTAFSGTINDNGTGTLALTKVGSGALTLSGGNTYTGNTTISAGALIGQTGGSCANSVVTVAAGATNGVQVAAANGQWSCSGLTYSSGTTYADFDFGSVAPSTTVAPLSVGGNVTTNGTVQVIVRNGTGFAAGQVYRLMAWTGTGPGNLLTFNKSILPSGVVGTLTLGTKTINLSAGIYVPNLFFTNAPGVARIISTSDLIAAGLASAQSSPAYTITVGTPVNGGYTITNSAGSMMKYTNSSSFAGASDSFSYTVSDGTASATATVSISMAGVAGMQLTPGTDGNGHPVISFHGIPNYTYHMQRSPDLTTWTTLQAVTCDNNGNATWTDTNTPIPNPVYYRLSYP